MRKWRYERSNSLRNKRSTFRAGQLPLDALLIDRDSPEPIQRQLYAALRDLILRRVLTPGLKLPSTRELSKRIMVSRNTVVRAYEQLDSEGYVETRQGSNTCVADLPLSPSSAIDDDSGKQTGHLSNFGHAFDSLELPQFSVLHTALRPSTPDVASFPFKTWNRLLGGNLLRQNFDLFNYNYPTGYPQLKKAIASYLQAYRGVRCEAHQILITNGAQSGLDLLSRVLLDRGDTVWMEEPGYDNARVLFSAAGAHIKPLHVTSSGWDLDRVPDGDIRLIYSTPSCQAPLGLTMRMEQRLRLLEIAHRKGAWIIEDDFDSEYRLTGASIPAMQGNDSFGRTIYIGTFAKTLFPAIRIGFVVLPRSIEPSVNRAAFYCGHQVSLPLQATLSDFIMSGHFARHLRRTRRLYAQRREVFLELSRDLLGEWMEPFEADVGIQVAFRFKRSFNDAAIARRANELNLNVVPLSRYCHFSDPIRGLVFGYAALDESSMRTHLSTLVEIIRASEGA
ncbi:PLP-dependent aminotransferase family protein [Aquamicrobium sp. LC103]|uniref:rhizopine catabolism transcriptional regulator MocR n=1 Tax=Aquamicrobium sp. LC103 TaxID=1120658 RepID=UPI000699F3D8|nr:PLP-dependent aminotransferase family protein [Aquamicrobium sp. LC103]TKT69518.1 PLP-dependent aminotransferase family protein [Aquamicrobium sp. LC103]